MIRRIPIALIAALLAGCASNDLSEIGKEPAMSPVGSGMITSSIAAETYPTPPPQQTGSLGRSSLWNDRQSRLFTDPRALSPGDILTVRIAINDRAKFKNESDRSRTAARSLNLGLSGDWNGTGGTAEGSADIGSNTSTAADGETTRSENLVLSVAAVVGEVLPNGNLIIRGSQEVRVNAELRILTIAGIVRPTDIGPDNTIPYERIAEARVSYGGRGRLSEVQQPPYGQQFIDKVSPF